MIFLWGHGFSTSFCVFTLGYNENSHFSMAPNFEELAVIRKCAMAGSEDNRWDPWNAMEYPEEDDGPLDHYPILSQSSKPNLLCPRIPRGVAGCDFLLRWRRPIPRSLFGPDRPCLLFEAGLYGYYTAVQHGGFQPFPWIVAFFLRMLYSYTYILEVKLLAGPKGAGNQPDVIIYI